VITEWLGPAVRRVVDDAISEASAGIRWADLAADTLAGAVVQHRNQETIRDVPGKRRGSMTDDQQSTPAELPGWMQELIGQLHGFTERLEGLASLGHSLPSLPSLPTPPILRNWSSPSALSAAQLKSIAASVAAQRQSVDALKTQLSAFDEQLAVFERILQPLAEWSKAWADLEARLLPIRREPKAESEAGDS